MVTGNGRTFTYDGLKRPLTSVNPESGTINYTYDAVGNLLTKTQIKSVTVAYTTVTST